MGGRSSCPRGSWCGDPLLWLPSLPFPCITSLLPAALRTERLIRKVPQLVSSTLGLKASLCFGGSPILSPSGRVRIDKLPDQWVFRPEEAKKAAGRMGSHVSFLTWGCYSFSRLRGSRWALGHKAALQFFVLLTTWARNAAGY